MRARIAALVVIPLCVAAGLASAGQKGEGKERLISRAVLADKIKGGWAGQMVGVSYGAPTEFRHLGKIIEGDLPWSPERVSNSINQDDLYVEMTFAEVMDRVGLDATTEQYGDAFRDSKDMLWHANAGARRALNRGIRAPMSGHPKVNVHANDIDFQIEADFIGLMTPGLPRESNRYCDRVGRVMNYGDGLYGGMFVAGMYSTAFFESDVRRVVEQGLACLPARSGYARLIADVLRWSREHPDDWKKTWQAVQEKWDRDDPCPGGALQPFNIDARLNGAYIAIGMLYGEGDFGKTVEITTRCGQDSDCNPASSAGVLGVMLGYDRIPDNWKSGIPALADQKFAYTNYSFKDVLQSTMDRALKVVTRAGGRVTEREVLVPVQTPQAPPLEQWDMGVPERVVRTDEPAWKWHGTWTAQAGRADRLQLVGKTSTTPGSECTLEFSGTAVQLVGPCSQDGGRADVYLDGKKVGELDAFVQERTNDQGLWHTYDLRPGPHTLRVVLRDDADARSKGKRVTILSAVPFRERK